MLISFRYLGIKIPLSFMSQIPVAISKLDILGKSRTSLTLQTVVGYHVSNSDMRVKSFHLRQPNGMSRVKSDEPLIFAEYD